MAKEKSKKTCFVVSPIGEVGSKIRDRADKVLKHIIRKTIEPLGYEVRRVDKIVEPGIITSDIIQHLLTSELVIADLTGHNPNVFYELAVRHATGKPLIQISAEGEKLPFDVANVRTIFFNHQDLDSVEECCNSISAQVKSIEASEITFENPISNAVNLSELQGSNKPIENTLAQLLTSVDRLRYEVNNIIRSKNQNTPSSSVLFDLLPTNMPKEEKVNYILDVAKSGKISRQYAHTLLAELEDSESYLTIEYDDE